MNANIEHFARVQRRRQAHVSQKLGESPQRLSVYLWMRGTSCCRDDRRLVLIPSHGVESGSCCVQTKCITQSIMIRSEDAVCRNAKLAQAIGTRLTSHTQRSL